MASYKVTFNPSGVTVDVDPELYPYSKHGEPGSILDIALVKGVRIEHACGGVGICASCHVIFYRPLLRRICILACPAALKKRNEFFLGIHTS